MLQPIRDHSKGENFGGQKGFVPGTAVAENARKFSHFGDPAAIGLTIKLYGQLHMLETLPLSEESGRKRPLPA